MGATRRNRRVLVVVAGLAAIAVAAGIVGFVVTRPQHPPILDITASSTAFGTSAPALDTAASASPPPAAASPLGVGTTIGEPHHDVQEPEPDAAITWRSDGETTGAWIRVTWPGAVEVDEVRIDGAGGREAAFTGAVLTFSDGSSIMLTPDAAGNVLERFPSRSVTSAQLRFAGATDGATSIALHAFSLGRGPWSLSSTSAPEATVSSADSSAGALVDGDIGAGATAESWSPDETDEAAWIGFSWADETSVASIQVAGASDREGDRLSGVLVFSDGSRVVVSGIGSGDDPVTTVAFVPRMVRWVRLDIAGPAVEIAEFAVYGADTTPPRWPVTDGISVEPASPSGCSSSSAALGSASESALALVCPEVGAQVSGSARVVVEGRPGAVVIAEADRTSGAAPDVVQLAQVIASDSGRAVLEFEVGQLPYGPVAIRVTSASAPRPLYVQLFNLDGERPPDGSYAPPSATLRWGEEFDGPLSVSASGDGAVYAATKPSGEGGSEFGDAIFVDPARGRETLATLGDDYLRIRVEPAAGLRDLYGWGRTSVGGLLSSARIGGSGFSAQYGYFEARMLAPAGPGTWPAFWMLDTESVPHPAASGEVDAVELYGHNPHGSCHSMHNWPVSGEVTGLYCFDDNDAGDWALSWHTFGVQIRPGGADYFIDGRRITSRDGLLRDSTPYYFLVNLALGGGWPIDLSATGGVADLYVDWVRVYT